MKWLIRCIVLVLAIGFFYSKWGGWVKSEQASTCQCTATTCAVNGATCAGPNSCCTDVPYQSHDENGNPCPCTGIRCDICPTIGPTPTVPPGCPTVSCGADDQCQTSCGSAGQDGSLTCANGTMLECCIWNYSCMPPTCNTTAPTNISVTGSGSTRTLSWTKGNNGTQQIIYVGSAKSEVDANCPSGSSCIVKNGNVDKNATSYDLSNISESTVYYYKIITYKSSSCSSAATYTSPSSCDLSPSTLTLEPGKTATLTTSINDLGTGNYVLFSLDNVTNPSQNRIFTINPTEGLTYPYSTVVTASRMGTSTVTGYVEINSAPVCNSVSTVTVVPPGPWWQVKDGDVSTNGVLYSDVP